MRIKLKNLLKEDEYGVYHCLCNKIYRSKIHLLNHIKTCSIANKILDINKYLEKKNGKKRENGIKFKQNKNNQKRDQIKQNQLIQLKK